MQRFKIILQLESGKEKILYIQAKGISWANEMALDRAMLWQAAIIDVREA